MTALCVVLLKARLDIGLTPRIVSQNGSSDER